MQSAVRAWIGAFPMDLETGAQYRNFWASFGRVDLERKRPVNHFRDSGYCARSGCTCWWMGLDEGARQCQRDGPSRHRSVRDALLASRSRSLSENRRFFCSLCWRCSQSNTIENKEIRIWDRMAPIAAYRGPLFRLHPNAGNLYFFEYRVERRFRAGTGPFGATSILMEALCFAFKIRFSYNSYLSLS